MIRRLNMFWKKKQTKPKDTAIANIMNQIEHLSLGESLTYRVAETYGGDLAIIDYKI